ncbi:DMT family transporter [Natronococcus roseus]|uniref:DMT family transporter n=1 Tax=Natronococcus roseus TaxID=1052014 RepID=UPI00374CAC47
MTRYRNGGLFLTLCLIWGTTFVAISAGLLHFPPVLLAAFRYDLAAILLLAYVYHAETAWRPRGRNEWAEVAVGAVFLIAAYHAFLFTGQQYTTAATAAIVVSLTPILSAGFSRVFVPEYSLTPIGIGGLLFGVAGVVVIARPDPANLLSSDVIATGLIFCAASAMALGSVLSQRIESSLPTLTMQAWAMLGGAILMHAVSASVGEPIDVGAWTHPEAIGSLAFLVVVSSVLGFFLYFTLLENLGPVELNMVSYVAPAIAAVVGWLYLGDEIYLSTVFGFVLIAVGFVLTKRRFIARELSTLKTEQTAD